MTAVVSYYGCLVLDRPVYRIWPQASLFFDESGNGLDAPLRGIHEEHERRRGLRNTVRRHLEMSRWHDQQA